VHSVKTIDRVAVELGETVNQNLDLAICMKTEDGIIRVFRPGDDSVIAFAPFRIENLQELIEMNRDPERQPRCGLRRILTDYRSNIKLQALSLFLVARTFEFGPDF
jgi:hypothetical protein